MLIHISKLAALCREYEHNQIKERILISSIKAHIGLSTTWVVERDEARLEKLIMRQKAIEGEISLFASVDFKESKK